MSPNPQRAPQERRPGDDDEPLSSLSACVVEGTLGVWPQVVFATFGSGKGQRNGAASATRGPVAAVLTAAVIALSGPELPEDRRVSPEIAETIGLDVPDRQIHTSAGHHCAVSGDGHAEHARCAATHRQLGLGDVAVQLCYRSEWVARGDNHFGVVSVLAEATIERGHLLSCQRLVGKELAPAGRDQSREGGAPGRDGRRDRGRARRRALGGPGAGAVGPPVARPARGRVLRPPLAPAHARRHHRHQRQDDDVLSGRGPAARAGPCHRRHRHDPVRARQRDRGRPARRRRRLSTCS